MKFLSIIICLLLSSITYADARLVDLKIKISVDGSDATNFRINTNSGEEVEASILSEDQNGYSIYALPTIEADRTISVKLKVKEIVESSSNHLSNASFIIENGEEASLTLSDSSDIEANSEIKIAVKAQY